MTTVRPDLSAYFVSISPHLTNQLELQQRTVSTLKGLYYENRSSRTSTALNLHAIQAELARLAQRVIAVRTPGTLVAAGSAHVRTIQQLGSAAGELGEALSGEPAGRVQRIGRALTLALEAESSARTSTQSIRAALDPAAADIPIIGSIIAAILGAIAAIIVLIGTILSKAKEEEAEEKEKHRP